MLSSLRDNTIIRKHGADLVKDYHKSLAFNLVRTRGPISRADLTRITKMSPTSTGRIVQELIEENLITEVGQSSKGLGRRATLLDVNADGVLAIGVEIDTQGVSAGVVNLQGKLVSESYSQPLISRSEEDILNLTALVVDTVLQRVPDDIKEKLIGVGVTVPGAVTWPDGVVKFSPQLGWVNVELRSALEEKLGSTVFVENNVKASALAESLFGVAQGISDFVIVTLGSGMGVAIVSNGHLYRGPDNIAGEIGHTTVDPDGPTCDCGRKGCLQAYICILGIERISGRSFEEVITHARRGDRQCGQILDRAATYLAMGLSNLVCMYNPNFIVLDGYMLKAWPEVLDLAQSKFSEFLWRPVADHVDILPSGIKDYSAIISSAAVVLQEFLMTPVSIRENLM